MAGRICNLVLNTVASRDYRDALGDIIAEGMKRKRVDPRVLLLPPSVPPPLPRKQK